MSSFFSNVEQKLKSHIDLVIFVLNVILACTAVGGLVGVFGLLQYGEVGFFPLDIVCDLCFCFALLGVCVGLSVMFCVWCFVGVVRRYGLWMRLKGLFGVAV
jgi:hypothetical protein